jgi:hypothetical protein
VPYIDTKSKGSRFTALHFAVRNNQPEAVKLLIEKGAHIEAPDDNRMTPLHHAVAQGFVDVAKGTHTQSLTILTMPRWGTIDRLARHQCWSKLAAISKLQTSSSVRPSSMLRATASSSP